MVLAMVAELIKARKDEKVRLCGGKTGARRFPRGSAIDRANPTRAARSAR